MNAQQCDEGASSHANEVIKQDPSSPLGYEERNAALRGMGHYDDATHASETMLSNMSELPDPAIREQSCYYIRPERTREAIRIAIEDAICEVPQLLINTVSGRLCSKSEQAAEFELTPAFTRLISPTTTHIDHAAIAVEVAGFFRYATFSHKWEENEPLFETVIGVVVYDLESSPTHEKPQMFCKIAREAGFNWAWSNTCCIDKGDHHMLQQALVDTFKCYERSAMTIIFLRGVNRLAKRGALLRSLWSAQAWTLQEYYASKVVRIYTEDWTPYVGLDTYNHKESPEIILEIEHATGIPVQTLMALRPGLDHIREKLRLASTRQATRVEDAAYSMLGMFSASLPIKYGEGDKALGRLLAQLLTSSGDVSVLAWLGRSNTFNSCLPANITVFSQPLTTHKPWAIPDAEMETVIIRLCSFNLTVATDLYDRLSGLSAPSFRGHRLKLPCLSFKLGDVSVSWNGPRRVLRVQRHAVLGIVEIQTREDISLLGPIYLVHPWIDFLLDRQPAGGATKTMPVENSDDQSTMPDELPSLSNTQSSVFQMASLSPPSTTSPLEKQTRVLQFMARLRQPFGPLILAPTRQHADEYRRVVTESLITLQVEALTPEILDELVQGVRILDVL